MTRPHVNKDELNIPGNPARKHPRCPKMKSHRIRDMVTSNPAQTGVRVSRNFAKLHKVLH